MHRIGPQPQALHYSYEKAGLTLNDQAIPWNAEVVLVEVFVCLSAATPRRKADFQIQFTGQEPLPADNLRRHDGDDRFRLSFRLPTPSVSTMAEVRWRNSRLLQFTLPVISRDEFVQNLRLQFPTLFVRLDNQNIACRTFVSSQCKGLMASALIGSPTSLVPLLDLGLHVQFHAERGGLVRTVPAQLSSSQLSDRQALIAVVPRKFPKRIGLWTATWLAGDYPLATQAIRAVSQRHFQRSLRVCDTRILVQTKKDEVKLFRQLPSLNDAARVGPCFFVASRDPGMAGLCPLQVHAQMQNQTEAPLLMEQEVLITDGPTMVAPGTVDVRDLEGINGFELRLRGEVLGVLSLSPVPAANFTNEGGFKPPPDFSWSPAADEELGERLNRLLDGRGE